MSNADRGRGPIMLVTGSILQLFLGIIYVWSVFVGPVSEFFTWDVADVKLTSSYMLCCFVLGILTGGKLQQKVGTSNIVLAGGLLMAAGMLATSFVSPRAPWLIYITYGVLGGFGVGMAYNAVISCAQKWFPHKRGLATGVSVCMFGFSTVVFAPLVEALVGRLGLAGTLRLLAAAFCGVTLLLFRFIKMPADTGAQGAASSALLSKRQFTTGEMIKSREFYFIALSMMFLTAAYFILNPSFKSLAEERGLSAAAGTAIVMMTGIANALGRLAIPVLGDKIGRESAVITILGATALSTAALSFATGFLFMGAIAVIAFCYGGSSGIYPVVTADYFGIKNIGSNYGAVMVGFMLSSLFFPMIFGKIEDITVKFLALASLGALGILMIILLSLSKKKREQ